MRKVNAAFLVLFLATPLWGYAPDTAGNHEVLLLGGDEVVVDNTFNLLWERKSADPEAFNWHGLLFTWDEACEYAADLNARKYAGRTDWRLPSAMEYATLVDTGVGEPCIDAEAFPFNGNHHYWTASEYPPIPAVVQYQSFVGGNQFKWGKDGLMRVRCVAGGGWTALYPGNLDDFTLTEDYTGEETLVDNLTGLEWEIKTLQGDSPLGYGPVREQIDRLGRLMINLPGFLPPILDEYLASGFLEDQLPSLGPVVWDIIYDVPDFIFILAQDAIMILEEISLETAILGRRSMLMLYSHGEALAYVEDLNAMHSGAGFAGHNDWRLPTVDEIMTTTDWNRLPCVKEVFEPAFTWLYWTATANPCGSRHYFTCTVGSVVADYAPDAAPLFVRAVRGTMAAPVFMEPLVTAVIAEEKDSEVTPESAAGPVWLLDSDSDRCFVSCVF